MRQERFEESNEDRLAVAERMGVFGWKHVSASGTAWRTCG